MAELEQGLEELKVVKQAFKDNISANNVSTSNVEFRNMPDLLKQMEKKLPTQTKSIEPTKYPQNIKADAGYKLDSVEVKEIPSQYIIPTGTKEITENNEYDITQYSKVKVAVKSVGTGGNPKFSQLIDGTIESLEESDLSETNRIKDYTFYYCTNLTSAVIPSNITSIGASAFEGCSGLQTLVMADGVQSIGASAFKGINASAINIPTTLSVLESEVFANNTALNTITIPANIVEIKDNVFNGCSNLTEIIMESYVPIPVTENTFPANVTAIYVKYGAYDTYVASWSYYADKIVRLPAIPSTITITVNNYLGEVVSGAVVTIVGNDQTFTGTTNENGVFVQGDLQPATYTISVADLDGFTTPSVQEVVIVENSQNNIVVTYAEPPKFSRVFSENTPEIISQISDEISANNMTSAEVEATYGWKIGDTIIIPLSTGENIEVRINDVNHDYLLGDSYINRGLTLQTTHCMRQVYTMAAYPSSSSEWSESNIRNTILPNIKSTMPQGWQDVIKPVTKNTSGLNTTDELFLLSEIELTGEIWNNSLNGNVEGQQYEYWKGKTTSDRIMLQDADSDNIPDTVIYWWLRSKYSSDSSTKNTYVYPSGSIDDRKATTTAGISFVFCV